MKKILSGLCSVVLGMSVAFAQQDLQPLVNVKITKSESITLKQLKSRVESYQKQAGGNQTFTVAQKREILDAMIDEKLVVQAAQKAGISITDSQVNQYFTASISQQVGRQVTEQEFSTIIKEQTKMSLDDFMRKQVGMNVAEYKAYLKSQLIAQQYILSLKKSEIENVSATDSEIRSFYDKNKSSFAQSDVIKLFLVVAPKGKDAAAAKAKAESLYTDVKSKKLTIDKIKAQVQGNTAGYQAGDMYISKTEQAAAQLGKDYKDIEAIFANKDGFVSDVVETANDYQFFIIQERYPAKILTLNDVIQPGTNVSVYEFIKANLTQQKQLEKLSQVTSDVCKTLRTADNFKMIKDGAELEKLLNW